MNNDLISRKALKDALVNAHINMEITFDIGQFRCVMNTIDNAPTVEVTKPPFARPQGEWIKDNSGNRFCSECGSSALYHEIGVKFESRFCPNCGAYMKGGIDNTPTAVINKDFYKTDKSNPINRSDLFQ